ncbi:MAG: DUF2203 domain-containing protein [Nitrospiraceae bacterium]
MSWSERSESEPRTFSLHEANSLIPTLERELVRVKGCQRTLRAIQGDIRRASHAAEFGGGSVAGALYVDTLEQMSNSLRILQETGVLIKDLDRGLCDFPHRIGAKTVLLCWQLGEATVEWWHDLNTGFQGRRPIDLLPE